MIKKYKEFLKPIIIVLLSQSIGYFLIKTFIHSYNIINPIIKFPLIKYFALIYNSWYPFVFIISFIIFKKDKELYKKLILTFIIGIILSLITFIIYPTIIIRPDIEIKNIIDLILNITYECDTPAVNCLPSIHCLFCFIEIYFITKTKNLKLCIKLPIIIYFILIVLSTLFIHQHILIDAIFSLIYTVISILIIKFLYLQINRALNFIF